jgi:uncharacterized protein YjbI with pentapeptide repeats
MANEEQPNLLKAGVADWNAWREANPAAQIDLMYADLMHANLSDADLDQVSRVGAIGV